MGEKVLSHTEYLSRSTLLVVLYAISSHLIPKVSDVRPFEESHGDDEM